MITIGLTGGIGAGKSTVARLLAKRGAVLVDADELAREVVARGTSGLAAVAEQFGSGVISDDGSLDRAVLAEIIFADPAARARLEAITHPLIGAETARRVAGLGADDVLVHDVPLLVEKAMSTAYDVVVVVEAPLDVRVDRLVRLRGLSDEQVRARMAAQATPAERAAVADVVITNDGPVEALEAQVDEVWRRVLAVRSQR